MQDKILAMSKANPQTGFKLKVKDWAKASALHNAQNSLLGGTGEYPPNHVCGLLGHDFFDKKVLSTVAGRLGLDQCVFKGTLRNILFLIRFNFFLLIVDLLSLCSILVAFFKKLSNKHVSLTLLFLSSILQLHNLH